MQSMKFIGIKARISVFKTNLFIFQLVITYPTTFLSLPTTTLSCVIAEVDGDFFNSSLTILGCANCSSTSLALERGCMLNTSDGLSITYCSQVEDGNRPQVTSCYQGPFSTTNVDSFMGTSCGSAFEFCRVIIYTALFNKF